TRGARLLGVGGVVILRHAPPADRQGTDTTCSSRGRGAAMRIARYAALFFGFCVFSLAPSALNGGEALQMRVSPAIQRAPAMLTVRVIVESSSDNRLLQVVAESPTFYRGSGVEIDRANSSPLR